MTDSQKLDLLIDKFIFMDSRLDSIDSRLDTINSRLNNTDLRLSEVESAVKNTNLILENEIRVNIQRIAEGHLDLSRNLQKVMKPNAEVEMLAIKVRLLETDVNNIKQKMS